MTASTAVIAEKPDKARLVSVQWLRAIAATMVVIHHALFYSDSMQRLPVQTERAIMGFSSWWFGVHIFFLVSGFIMINAASEFGVAAGWRRFIARRLIRIVPLYWLVMIPIAVGAVIWPHLHEIPADRFQYILKSYLFIPALRAEGDVRPILGQGWTLDYEMFFYVVFGCAMILPRRKAIVALTAVFVTLVWLGRNLTNATPILFTWSDGIILEFLFGVYVGLAYQKGWRLPGWAAALAIGAGAVAVIADFQGPTFLVAGIPATLIVGGTVLGPQPGQSLISDGLARIGDASYSLYLTHTLVLRPLNTAWVAVVGDKLSPSIFVWIATVASIVAGLVVFRLIERPMTQFLQRWLLPGKPQRFTEKVAVAL